MVRYSSHLTLKEFARPPPSGVGNTLGIDEVHQFPLDVLRSKLELVTLTQYPSTAFSETWRWTRDYRGDRRETITLACAPTLPVADLSMQDLLLWLEQSYVRRRLDRVSAAVGVDLPRRRQGVRHYDRNRNFGEWQRQEEEHAIAFCVARPSTGNYNNSFAVDVDFKLRILNLFPYLPGDHLRVEYRPPVR